MFCLNYPNKLLGSVKLMSVLFVLSLKYSFETPCSEFIWFHSVISAVLSKQRPVLLGVA